MTDQTQLPINNNYDIQRWSNEDEELPQIFHIDSRKYSPDMLKFYRCIVDAITKNTE